MTLPVFIDPAVTAPPDGAGTLLAPAGIAHHAVTVRRMGPGEQLQLSDGAGLRLTGTITVAERSTIVLQRIH